MLPANTGAGCLRVLTVLPNWCYTNKVDDCASTRRRTTNSYGAYGNCKSLQLIG